MEENNLTSKVQIIQVATPLFEYDGLMHTVIPYMFFNLNGFQEAIEKNGEKGMTKCFLYSINTQHDPNQTMYFVRCRFF